MKKVITTMLVAAMVLSMAVPTSAATITRKKSTGTTASTTKVSGDYSLKMVDKTLQFIRGGKVVSSIETKDGKITLRKSSAGGISVVFTDANGKRRNITLGKQNSVALSGTFVQVSVDKALGSSFEVEMEKGSKVTNFYAKGAAKVTLNGSVTTLNVTSSNANVAANGTVSRAYAVNKKAISGMSAGKITQTSTGTSASGSVNTSTGSSSSSNTTVNSGSGSGSSSSGGSSGIIINGGGSNGGTNTVAAPKITQQPTNVEIEEGKSATLTIKATGTGKVSYQWYDAKTGKAITGATSSTLDVKPTETSSYYCMVTNTVGSKKATIRSITVTVTVKGQVVVVAAPVIKTEPADVTVEVGNPATLKVEVEAVAGLTPKYQWYTTNNDGATPVNTAIKDATEATYTVTPDVAGITNYYCTIINENKDGVKSEPATSKTASITATAKVADTDLAKAKTAIEALKDTEYADLDAVKAAITAAATANGVTADVSGLTLDGTNVAGNVVLSKDKVEETVTVPFTATIKAEPTENADLKAAKEAIEALTGPYVDVDEAKAAIKAAVTNEAITVDDSKVALSEDGKTIAGVVGLSIEVDGKPVTATANFSAAVAQEGEAETPVFAAKLQDASYTLDKAVALDGTATVPSGNTVTYQWYKGSSSDTTKGDEIPGATDAKYTPTSLGSFYYYVVATNTVGSSVKTAVSDPAYVTVTMPAGAAAIPTFTKDLNPTGDSKNYELNSPDVTDLSVTATATGAGADISYQWYSSTSASTDGGTKLDGETNNTFTPDTSVAGVTYYYCVATNTDSEATLEGYKSASVASKSVKITVAADNTMAVVSSDGANGTANTTTIELTFKYPMRGLKASDFTITPPVEDPVVESKVAITGLEEFNGGKTIKLTVSGVATTDNNKVFSLKLAKLPDGITMSKDTVAVTIYANTTPAPVADAKVVSAVANGSAGTKDTDAITVTFDKDPGDVEGKDFTFTGATSIALDATAVSGTGTTRVVKITLGVPANTDADKKITMTKAGADTTSTDIEVNRDTKAPEFFGATVENTDPDTVVLTFKDNLDETSLPTDADFVVTVNGDTADNKATGAAVTVEGKKVKIKLADNLKSTDSVLVSYTGTSIKDTSVAKNEAAKFENQVVTNRVEAAASPKLAEASLSADGGTLNVGFDRPVKEAAGVGTGDVAAIKDCIKVEGVPAGVTYTVTLEASPARAANKRFLQIKFNRALTAEESAKLKVTFEVEAGKKSPITDLNDTPMVDNTTPVTPDTDNVVEKAAGEATAQAGTNKKNIVVELTAGKFVDAATTPANWELVHDGGSNTISSVVKDSDTKVTITLANAIADADKFTIKPKAAALDTTVAAEPVTPFTVTVAPTTVSATASGTVTGVPGTAVTGTVTITLADGAFNEVTAGANTWIKNLPADLEANIATVNADATSATITVSGTPKAAASGTIEITIPKEVIKDAAGDVVVESSAKYEIGAQKAVISSAEGDYEGTEITVTLSDGKFDEAGSKVVENWTIANLPQGVNVASVAYTDEKNATITLSGDIPSTEALSPAITVLPKAAALDATTTTPPDAAKTVTLNAVTAVATAKITTGQKEITVTLESGSFDTTFTGTTGWEIGGTDASNNTVSSVSIISATTATVEVGTAISTGTVNLTIPQGAFVTDTTTAPSAITITIE